MGLEHLKTDILILGSGGAGLFAALHALKANPDLDITVASKGLLGLGGLDYGQRTTAPPASVNATATLTSITFTSIFCLSLPISL